MWRKEIGLQFLISHLSLSIFSINIVQKRGLFGLQSYANINKVEIFHVLGPRHLRHDKVALLIIIRGDSLSMTEQEIDCKG